MVSFILQNIIAIALICFLLVGLAISWKIKTMRYFLITSSVIVVATVLAVNYGGLTVEKLIAKSGYILLFLVWFTVLIVFIIGMYRLWKNFTKTDEN